MFHREPTEISTISTCLDYIIPFHKINRIKVETSRIRLDAAEVEDYSPLNVCREEISASAIFFVSRSPLHMLPRSSLPSLQEKLKAHRDREEHCIVEDGVEAEKSARFSSKPHVEERKSYADLLLGPEFEVGENEDLSLDPHDGANVDYSVFHETEKDWTCSGLSPELISKLEAVKTITISVPRPNGGAHNVLLCTRTLNRLRGSQRSSTSDGLSWLDDNVIDGFTALINARSEECSQLSSGVHKPSKNADVFNRSRVRAFVFSTQFFSIWNQNVNGGYESVRKWRRKVQNYNTVGIFMFPAFVHGNHWVLAIVDVDGQQFMYYDPQGNPDNNNVMRCAKEWIQGEVRTAPQGDAFKHLRISSWPVQYNPGRLPLQNDLESCGIFVLYVAEHIERGRMPQFDQSGASVLRMRTLLILSHQIL